MTDYMKHEISQGNFVGMIFIDLRKAFDTVDHDILLDKLRAIGVSSIDWFSSYLSNRSRCVEVNGVKSDFLPISCGVPQGSILGPQLFLIYINDMSISLNCSLSLYADDSALIFAHKDPSVISSRLSTELNNCRTWLVDNKLSLHVGKTESVLFGPKRKLKRVETFSVSCDGKVVQRVTQVKYLGVMLDDCLSGSAHVGNVLKVCAGRLAFLYRHKTLLDFQCRKSLCVALIQPFLDYCASSWYEGLTVSLKNRLDVVQRKMIRFTLGLDFRDHVGKPDLRSLKWLNVPDRIKFFNLIHLFRIKHGLGPKYLRQNFASVSDTHSHFTRGSRHNFHVSKSSSLSPSSFTYACVQQWNALPEPIKNIESLSRFKQALKEYFLDSYD